MLSLNPARRTTNRPALLILGLYEDLRCTGLKASNTRRKSNSDCDFRIAIEEVVGLYVFED